MQFRNGWVSGALVLGCVAAGATDLGASAAPPAAAVAGKVVVAQATPPAAPRPAGPAPTAQVRAGILKSVQGTVMVGGDADSWRAAQPGSAVSRAEQIRTEPDSGAAVVFADGTTVVVGPSTRLDLKDFSFDAVTLQGSLWLNLLRGSARFVSGLIGKQQPANLRIQSRALTVGIRGTDFIVEAEEE